MVLSIDEHYFLSSYYVTKYCCLFMNFQTGVMIYIIYDQKKNCLTDYFSSIKNETLDMRTLKSELDNVKCISIDMYLTEIQLISSFLKLKFVQTAFMY